MTDDELASEFVSIQEQLKSVSITEYTFELEWWQVLNIQEISILKFSQNLHNRY